jgi:glutamate-1-semialdehyde aminotransferase
VSWGRSAADLRRYELRAPSALELEAAESFVDLIDAADMVKFTKDGSTANTAAVKLARAFTGRDLVAICTDHPFYSYDDWAMVATPIKAVVAFRTYPVRSLEPRRAVVCRSI